MITTEGAFSPTPAALRLTRGTPITGEGCEFCGTHGAMVYTTPRGGVAVVCGHGACRAEAEAFLATVGGAPSVATGSAFGRVMA